MIISPLAGQLPPDSLLVDVPKLITSYYVLKPNPHLQEEKVSFGTSGHRGSSFKKSFNENHILSIAQAICDFRKKKGIDGPLFLGVDTHALSYPAMMSAIEVLIANGVDLYIAEDDEYTPTPVISHAILTYNKGRTSQLADGIVITPSHNPPDEGGFKYNSTDGGPAQQEVTNTIQKDANQYLITGLQGIKRTLHEEALSSKHLHRHNFMDPYIKDLKSIVDMDLLRGSKISIGVDPLGGAGVQYWKKIKDFYGLNMTILNEKVDPTFRFMPVDWDGQIRMDPSSPYAMHHLIGFKDQYDVVFACDTDHDRHGVVAKSVGLLPPNHYFAAAAWYLFHHRPNWNQSMGIGKTVVTTQMLDRVAEDLGRKVDEVPVGFKWFVEGLLHETLGFACEESAGASFLRFDGAVWSTDKDGIIPGLLAAEMMARLKMDPGKVYQRLTEQYGEPKSKRIEGHVTLEQREELKKLTAEDVKAKSFGGKKIKSVISKAPGNQAPIGGIKIILDNGWLAVRPSGTEPIYKIYAEVFGSDQELQQVVSAAEDFLKDFLGIKGASHE